MLDKIEFDDAVGGHQPVHFGIEESSLSTSFTDLFHLCVDVEQPLPEDVHWLCRVPFLFFNECIPCSDAVGFMSRVRPTWMTEYGGRTNEDHPDDTAELRVGPAPLFDPLLIDGSLFKKLLFLPDVFVWVFFVFMTQYSRRVVVGLWFPSTRCAGVGLRFLPPEVLPNMSECPELDALPLCLVGDVCVRPEVGALQLYVVGVFYANVPRLCAGGLTVDRCSR